MSDDEEAYARLVNDLDAEARDAAMGCGANTEDRPHNRLLGASKKKPKTNGDDKSGGLQIVLVLIGLVLFVAMLKNWYFTLPVGILCAYFFGYRVAVLGIIVATIATILIQGEIQEAREAKKAMQKECITTLVSDAAEKHYGKPVSELNIFNRSRVNRAIKKGSMALVKQYEEGGIQAVEIYIVEEQLVAAHSKQEFMDGMNACVGETRALEAR